jgi:type IV pilus assembly protein PilC
MAKPPSRITLKDSEKISLITNLSTMLTAGIPIVEAVNSLLEDTKGGQKIILETLRTDLMQGNRMYSSLAKFPAAFDPVTINLVKASEEAGTLDTILLDLRSHIQKEMEFADRIKSALLYPMVIMVIFALMLLMILVFVIPRITTVFKKLQIELPLPTRVMIFISDVMLQQTWTFIGGIGIILAAVFILYKKKKSVLARIATNLPIVSGITKQIDLTRFSRNLFLLLSAGLPITTAMELSQNVVIRPQTAAIIKKSRDLITSGKRFSDGLRAGKGFIPSIMIKLIEAGEKSGSLDKSLQDISDFMDYQVSNSLKNITALIEPVMLVLVGIFTGAMMLAIIAPIYGLIGQLGGR